MSVIKWVIEMISHVVCSFTNLWIQQDSCWSQSDPQKHRHKLCRLTKVSVCVKVQKHQCGYTVMHLQYITNDFDKCYNPVYSLGLI